MKNKLRKEILAKRNLLSIENRNEKSSEIVKNIFSLKCIKKNLNIFSYISTGSEVNTHYFIDKILEKKGYIAVPKCNKQEKNMYAVNIRSKKCLQRGAFGILEPNGFLEEDIFINPHLLDITIIPGIVFDINGGRIGYGGGYYDRFFDRGKNNCLKIGLCFEIQLQEKVVQQDHDILMDYIITEKSIIRV